MEIVNMRTKDGIALKGLLYESFVNNEICLFIPGCCGNFVDNDFMRIISEILYENGYNVLCANTRGSFMMNSSFHPYNLERPKKIGVAYEKFEDCVNDIDGWISYLKDRGYSSVNVISHSSGANKLIYYMNCNLENKQLINKIVMLSPPDFMNRIRCYPDFQDLVNEATNNIINGEPDKMMKAGATPPGHIAGSSSPPAGARNYIRSRPRRGFPAGAGRSVSRPVRPPQWPAT